MQMKGIIMQPSSGIKGEKRILFEGEIRMLINWPFEILFVRTNLEFDIKGRIYLDFLECYRNTVSVTKNKRFSHLC